MGTEVSLRAYPNNGCTWHVEPFDYAQDKLRETSLFSGKCEILRFAAHDMFVILQRLAPALWVTQNDNTVEITVSENSLSRMGESLS